MLELEQVELPFEVGYRVLSVSEIYRSASASVLRILSEDRRIERKVVGIHAKELGDYLAMWSNTAPDGGLIAVGISNAGMLEGICGKEITHVNNLERSGDVHAPDARYETKRIRFDSDGKPDEILLFRVFYNDKKLIRTADGKVYVRRGESKREIKGDELRELQTDKGEVAWEQEDSVTSYPEGFNTEAISQFVLSVVRRRELSADKTNEEVLSLRRLGRFVSRKFRPNKACALLFAADPCRETPGCKIRFLRFDGKVEGVGEKFNAVKDMTLEGTIPNLIVQAERILDEQLREFSRLGKDGTFCTAPEYPKPAWYEAVVNACCHRSYSLKNTPIFIKMFDDRLEIDSPGGFMPFVTPESIYEQHHPRNPQMMDALFHLSFVKCAHEGTRRMRDTMLDVKLPAPNFLQKEVAFARVMVTLRNNIEQRKVWVDSDAIGVIGEMLFNELTSHQRRIINFVAEYKTISVSQVQRITSLSWPASKKLLEGLVEKKILHHVIRAKLERDPQARYILRGSR